MAKGSPQADPGLVAGPQNIIWIASYPKSGNTWVRVFLHNLAHEMLGRAESAQDLNALTRFTVWESGLGPFAEVLGKPPREASAAEISQARPRVQRLIAERRRPKLTFAKTHLAFGRDHGYPTIDLGVTHAVIYIVRNPLDVAVSYAHHRGVSIDRIIAEMAMPAMYVPTNDRHVSETIGSWSQHVESWMGITDRPVHIMRYEDVLAHQLQIFGGLSHFLKLRPSEGQLRAAIEKSSFETLARQEAEAGFWEKPGSAKRFFREGVVGAWREQLTQSQVSALIEVHGAAMMRAGYIQSVGSPRAAGFDTSGPLSCLRGGR